jgi:hypothetical protein
VGATRRARNRSRLSAVLVAAVLAIAMTVLVLQAGSIWSATTQQLEREDPSDVSMSVPELIHPGKNRGQVRFGRFIDPAAIVRPHGPHQRPKWGS